MRMLVRLFIAWAGDNGMSPDVAIFTLLMLLVVWLAGVILMAPDDSPLW